MFDDPPEGSSFVNSVYATILWVIWLGCIASFLLIIPCFVIGLVIHIVRTRDKNMLLASSYSPL